MFSVKWITSIGRALAKVVVDLWTRSPDVGRHYWVTKDGVHQCAYCQAPFTELRARERCPVFQ